MSSETPDYLPASRSELALVVSGVLIFIVSFLPWYGVDFEGGVAEAGVTGSYNAWHGITAAGLLLVLFSLVVSVSGPLLGEDVPIRLLAVVTAVLACTGAAFVVVRSFDLPSPDIPGASVGLRWGGWILVCLVIVHAAISVLRALNARDGH